MRQSYHNQGDKEYVNPSRDWVFANSNIIIREKSLMKGGKEKMVWLASPMRSVHHIVNHAKIKLKMCYLCMGLSMYLNVLPLYGIYHIVFECISC